MISTSSFHGQSEKGEKPGSWKGHTVPYSIALLLDRNARASPAYYVSGTSIDTANGMQHVLLSCMWNYPAHPVCLVQVVAPSTPLENHLVKVIMCMNEQSRLHSHSLPEALTHV